MDSRNAKSFKLNQRGVMLALVSAALSQSALANTGHVDFAVGSIVVTGANGQVHTLFKGTEVGTGDKITSGADGRAQIRFTDGAYVSLQPNTEFDIKQYRYNGKADGTESAIFGLFKGALRTVTGLVGRVNRSKYQITTPTATIGIRGTGGLIQVGGDGSTLVIGSSGIWSLTNNGGTLDVPAGTAGFAGTNRNAPPQQTTQGPIVPPTQPTAPPPLPPYVQGDTVGPMGNSIVPTSGPGYAVAFFGAGGPNFTTFAGGPIAAPTNAVFDSTGQLTQFDTLVSGVCILPCFTLATYTLAGTQMETGTDGFLSWGRWTGDVLLNGTLLATLTANQGLHYVTGIPTPAASMPISGTFTYNLIGATSPTFANGSAAPGVLNSASLTGDFTNKNVSVSLSATAGGSTYSGSASALITIASATFSGSGAATGTGSACSLCTLGVNGFFSGTGATHAGIIYQFTGVQNGSTTLNGAAAFSR